MGIREVLQTEIWSKETSRKILAGLRKILGVMKYVGLVLGVVVVGVVLWAWIWTHWLTAKERNAGSVALVQVDALQNFDGMSDADFDAKVKLAQEKVDAANHAVLTEKDNEVAGTLWFYLDQIKFTRLRQKRMHEVLNSHPEYARTDRYRESDLKMEKSERDYIKIWRDSAHELLDMK
jgi:hypothetical protein